MRRSLVVVFSEKKGFCLIMTNKEKCSYLRGLADGLKLDTDKAEGKLISELIDLCAQMAEDIEEMDDAIDTLQDYAEELDEDLGDVEELVFEMEDGEECDCECDDEDDGIDCDGDCEGCSGCDYEEDCDNMRCALCSECGDTICFDEEMDPEKIVCPNCGTPLVSPVEEEE